MGNFRATLYHLIAGRPPFQAGSVFELLQMHKQVPPKPLDVVRPDVPQELATVVGKMLAKDPARRYQTPADVARALAPFAVATPERPDPPRWPWAVAVGVVLVALVGALFAGGAFRVKTKEGTIVLENLPADAEVLVDGETVTVTRNGEQATVSLAGGGPHKLRVVQGGREITSSDVTVTVGGNPVRVRVEPPAAVPLALPPAKAEKVPPKEPAKAAPIAPDRRAFIRGKEGRWSIVGDVLVGEAASSALEFGDAAWTDYVFSFEVRVLAGPPEFGLEARKSARPQRGGYGFKLGTIPRNADLWVPHAGTGPAVSKPKQLRWDAWNRVQLSVLGDRVRGYAGPVAAADGLPVVEATERTVKSGWVGLGIGYPQQKEKAVVHFRNIKVTAPDGKVLWEGLPELPK